MVNSSRWPQWLRSEFDGMTSAGVALFVGAPLLVGVLLGWNRMVVGSHMSRPGSTLYWIGLIAIVWVAAIVGTRLVRALARRWRRCWQGWATAATGALLGIFLFYWPISAYRHFGHMWLPAESIAHAPPLPWPTLEYLPQLFANTLPGVLYWVAVTYLVERFFSLPRDAGQQSTALASAAGSAESTAAVTLSVDAEPILRARLPADLDGEILALKAEDHYLRVYTAKGDTLVHYRFRDALHDLKELDGLQVHRSYWVRRSAIAQRFTENQKHFLRLSTNLKVSVSRSYLAMLDSLSHKAERVVGRPCA